MKNQILNKILNDDGSLVWKYSKTACVQKYFTKDEIEFLNNCFGKTFSEKLSFVIFCDIVTMLFYAQM